MGRDEPLKPINTPGPAHVVDEDPYNLDDLKDNPRYDASAETLTDEPSDIGIFDMLIPGEPCSGNGFANYGEDGY